MPHQLTVSTRKLPSRQLCSRDPCPSLGILHGAAQVQLQAEVLPLALAACLRLAGELIYNSLWALQTQSVFHTQAAVHLYYCPSCVFGNGLGAVDFYLRLEGF